MNVLAHTVGPIELTPPRVLNSPAGDARATTIERAQNLCPSGFAERGAYGLGARLAPKG